jgi:hypothetical protein
MINRISRHLGSWIPPSCCPNQALRVQPDQQPSSPRMALNTRVPTLSQWATAPTSEKTPLTSSRAEHGRQQHQCRGGPDEGGDAGREADRAEERGPARNGRAGRWRSAIPRS